ncbi:hypothetical protein JHK87_009920 [Glycine soja]|nr:hypothetical protein JHK87_009920 [Glycine soja]
MGSLLKNSFLWHNLNNEKQNSVVIELVDLVARRSCLPIVVCCSTCDNLDSLCTSLSALPFLSSSALYSDLGEDEHTFILEKFRQVMSWWYQTTHDGAPNKDEELPLDAHLLINYELPTKKETYGRFLTTCLTSCPFLISRYCAYRIVINMVVGGKVVTLKSIEESSHIVMQETPMQILDIL